MPGSGEAIISINNCETRRAISSHLTILCVVFHRHLFYIFPKPICENAGGRGPLSSVRNGGQNRPMAGVRSAKGANGDALLELDGGDVDDSRNVRVAMPAASARALLGEVWCGGCVHRGKRGERTSVRFRWQMMFTLTRVLTIPRGLVTVISNRCRCRFAIFFALSRSLSRFFARSLPLTLVVTSRMA